MNDRTVAGLALILLSAPVLAEQPGKELIDNRQGHTVRPGRVIGGRLPRRSLRVERRRRIGNYRASEHASVLSGGCLLGRGTGRANSDPTVSDWISLATRVQ